MAQVKHERSVRDDDAVLTLLEPDQLVEARLQPFGRRQLSTGARTAMWCLRVYAVLMMLVVLYDVVRLIQHGAP